MFLHLSVGEAIVIGFWLLHRLVDQLRQLHSLVESPLLQVERLCQQLTQVLMELLVNKPNLLV